MNPSAPIVVSDVGLQGRLSSVSATIEPGQITAICGPNGAGKSTLLSIMASLLMPDRGSVALGARSLPDMPPQLRAQRIGFLPQSAEIAWDVCVRNLVALGRLPHRDRGELAIAAAMEAVNLTDFADRPISTLSGGEQARALLARVLAGEPDWILADEPLAALDFYHQQAVMRSLRASADAGVGVVIVLHDLATAINRADRVLVLDRGEVAADGAPEQALAAQNIARIWGVDARWIGDPGSRALIMP